MEGNPTITNLKDFVDFYEPFKSDVEMASLLDISVEEVKAARMDIISASKGSGKQILNLV